MSNSVFGNALESADLGYENDAPLANGEETHTVANEIAEVQGLQFEAADAIEKAETLDDEAEKAEEVAETISEDVAQERALDPTSARLLALTFKNIVGKKHAQAVLPATESYNGSRSQGRENTRMALEAIQETLKQFWEAIKAQFNKAFTAIKSWIVKTFSTAKKLKERAEKLQSKANDTVGTIEEKSFSFSQTKAIAVDGKYNDPSSLTSSLTEVRKIIDGTLTELKKGKVDDAVEGIVKAIEGKASGSGSIRVPSADAVAGALLAVGVAAQAGNHVPASVGDAKKFADQYGDSNEVTVRCSSPLPGGKMIINVQPKQLKGDSLEDVTKLFKGTRVTLGADRYTPREVSEGDVKTLTTSQVDKVCDDVIEIAEKVFSYEKEWKNRENFITKVMKETDQTVKDFDQEDDAKDGDKRHFRGFINAQVAMLRREMNFEANLCSYGLTTSNAFLNYAERSLAQHKAK